MDQHEILRKAETWLSETYDERTRAAVRELISQGGEPLADAFYQDLDFGTGGLRGVMGPGTNRINRYTLGAATQGLVHYLQSQFADQTLRVVVAHDSRHNSQHYAQVVGEILSANGVEALLFEDLRPTPELSFAIRYHQCQSGIMITASHNPPEYNGYKVYWQDGGQLVPPHDQGLIAEVRKVKHHAIQFGPQKAAITTLGRETDQAYLENIQHLSFQNAGKEQLKTVFTSIHGTSITLVPQAFENAGFKHFFSVKEQAQPDGDFPTVKSPNPEEAAALEMALDLAWEKEADLVIGTDPDADRVGIAVRNLAGELELLNGNQAAAVLLYYLLEQNQQKGLLTGKEFIAKTVVTSDLLSAMAQAYEVPCLECLTGFKWIADLIRREEGKRRFIGGGEESYGYLIGDFVRDKDAVASAVMLAEAAAYAQSKGSSFYGMLLEVYQKFGFYLEELISMTRKGRKGAEEITQMMADFRERTPETLGGEKVTEVLDFQAGQRFVRAEGQAQPLDFPKSNVVQFLTEQGSRITARPSGTEPKIKFYISVNTRLAEKAAYEETRQSLRERIARIREDLGI
ncbi:MAG: phospho-sugar mutase [Schleiferiaceae bacterium]|nr:phospho-sugar mutase [Schleiferiaceae bacterium]